MTEVLNASQLALLRRIAAAGYVRIVTAGEKTTLDELHESSSSEINSPKLDGGNFGKSPGIARVVNPVRSVATEQKHVYPHYNLATATI